MTDLSIKIFVVEDTQYREGQAMGAWFELPVSRAVIAEKINLQGQYDGFEILDYEAPFLIDPFTPIEFLNHVATLFEEYKGHESLTYVSELMNYDIFKDFDEAMQRLNDIEIHSEITSFVEFAQYFIEDNGYLSGLPELIRNHIDYEGIAGVLRNEKHLYRMSDGVIVEVH
ncbi:MULTISPECIES: antirestriction protein ArdA [unclassified Enterococcus]|uniref:antirestriction protein ArdA n=1 Tax=unclassified Enterococcus TaxID=2608891 RepID=UPI001903CE75|nr:MULTISPECIES: antirestriction protein ArdA [unclassified Enterococcus]MBK0036043.1 antirestriction protein ArdA [Enterococcus sp. S52]MBK0068701.1 antirestriction protein ArdA [Enterococcus sp. S53]MBK0139294.1 antirestriction protein ArdA [Enterococcus sp. S76]MBK0142929.1 antirestriction protein ArdA [Enterococcus sp. S77]